MRAQGKLSGGRWAVWTGLLTLCSVMPAVAQDIQHFHPSLGHWNYLSIDGASVGSSDALVTSLYVHYASNPLVMKDPAQDAMEPLVSDLTTAEFMAAWRLNHRVQLGVALPISHATKTTELDIDDGSGMGDLRVLPKLVLLGSRRPHGLKLAVKMPLTFPTSQDEHEFSERHFTVAPTLISEYGRRTWRVALNLGYRWLPTRPNELAALAVGDGMKYGVALALVPPKAGFEFIIETFGSRYQEETPSVDAPHPVEVMSGIRIFGPRGLSFTMGAGGGLEDDFSAPEFRAVGGLTWSLNQGASGRAAVDLSDSDGDGIRDISDACPDVAEDPDGFQDVDGCPETDNDADGLADDVDACPLHPEDRDGYKDTDGCPDHDNDGDGVADVEDRCPQHKEDATGSSPRDGCPDDAMVVVEKSRIRHLERIYFDTEKASIQPQSYGLLDRIAVAILQRPRIRKIVIEGHTDAFGSEAFNQKLAHERAESVRQYLIHSGVPADRLEAVGFGEKKVVGDGRSEVDARLSRRVEFRITERVNE